MELTRRVTGTTTCDMTTAQERKQLERKARRRRIQEAARLVFAERGYAKTSIERVARQASLSVGAIYLYFSSKEDLYLSLLEETLDVFDTELGKIRARADMAPEAQLQAAWSFLVQWAVSDVEGTRILRLLSQPNVNKQLSDEVSANLSRGLGQVRQYITSIIDAGIATGGYKAAHAEEAADLLWALFLGLLQQTDARANLAMSGPTMAEAAKIAITAIEVSLRRRGLVGVAEAA